MAVQLTTLHRFDAIEAAIAAADDRLSLYSDPGFQSQLAGRVDTLLKGRKVLSLDVFDTLILRDNSAEVTRFFEVGGKMAKLASKATGSKINQVDAFLARQLGTGATYRASKLRNGCREGSLTEIHETAARLLTGSDVIAGDFVEAELKNESTRITPNPFYTEYIENARAAGVTIALVSDMYMHADQIAALLTDLGISAESYDVLVSSADTKVSKSSGGIFSEVEEQLEVSATDIAHIGDSRIGDVLRPKQHGWAALHLPLSDADIDARKADEKHFAEILMEQHGIALD